MSVEKKMVYVRMLDGRYVQVDESRRDQLLKDLSIVDEFPLSSPGGVEDKGDSFLVDVASFYIPLDVKEIRIAKDKDLCPYYEINKRILLSDCLKDKNQDEVLSTIGVTLSMYAQNATYDKAYVEWAKTSAEAEESRRKAALFENAWKSCWRKIAAYEEEDCELYDRTTWSEVPFVFAHYPSVEEDARGTGNSMFDAFEDGYYGVDIGQPLVILKSSGIDYIYADTTDEMIENLARQFFDWSYYAMIKPDTECSD